MSRPGFTLVEVLVGLVVASLALAAGFGALAVVSDRATHMDTATVSAIEGAARREQLIEILTGARLRHAGERFQGLDPALLGTESSELIVPTTARLALDEPIVVARLFIDEDPATPERGLVAELIARQGDTPVYQELVPEAGTLTVWYGTLNATGEMAWQPAWLANRLPDAIELVLTPAPGEVLPPLLAYPIRVRLEAAQ